MHSQNSSKLVSLPEKTDENWFLSYTSEETFYILTRKFELKMGQCITKIVLKSFVDWNVILCKGPFQVFLMVLHFILPSPSYILIDF